MIGAQHRVSGSAPLPPLLIRLRVVNPHVRPPSPRQSSRRAEALPAADTLLLAPGASLLPLPTTASTARHDVQPAQTPHLSLSEPKTASIHSCAYRLLVSPPACSPTIPRPALNLCDRIARGLYHGAVLLRHCAAETRSACSCVASAPSIARCCHRVSSPIALVARAVRASRPASPLRPHTPHPTPTPPAHRAVRCSSASCILRRCQ